MPATNRQPALDNLFKPSPLAWRARYQASKTFNRENEPAASAAAPESPRRLGRLLARRTRRA
jgi:hypothetical protein